MGDERAAAGRQVHIALTLAAARGSRGALREGTPAQGRAEGPTAQMQRESEEEGGEGTSLAAFSVENGQ